MMPKGLTAALTTGAVLWLCAFATGEGGVEPREEKYNQAVKNGLVMTKSFSQSMSEPLTVNAKSGRVLDMYCFVNPLLLSLKNIWTSVCYHVHLHDGAMLYSGHTELEVFELAEGRALSWSALLSWSTNSVCFPPFNSSCVGIDSVHEYKLNISVVQVSPWLVGYFFVGIFLFFFANDFSRSSFLYYVIGITLGLLSSVLIALVAFAYLFPKKQTMLFVSVVVGGSLALWLLRLVWFNLQFLLASYASYVCAYVGLCSFLSFAVLHVRGPITNPRVHELIAWTLQLGALVLVYHGTQIPWLSVTVIILLVCQHIVSGCVDASSTGSKG